MTIKDPARRQDGETLDSYMVRRDAMLRASRQTAANSPAALESVLAQISADVTDHAAARDDKGSS